MRIKLNEFWMGITTNLVAAAMIAFGTGLYGLFAGQPWPVIAGLVLSAFGTSVSLYGIAVSEKRATFDVPNDKLKPLLRAALDNIGMSTRFQDNQTAEFEIAAVDFRGLVFSLIRPQKNRQYLCVVFNQGFSQDQSSQFTKLSQDAFLEMNAKISLDVARAKIGFGANWPQSFSVTRLIPITSRLSEADILNALVDVESAAVAVGCTVSLTFLQAKIPFPVDIRPVAPQTGQQN